MKCADLISFKESDLKSLFEAAKVDKTRFPSEKHEGSARHAMQNYLQVELSRVSAISAGGANFSQQGFKSKVIGDNENEFVVTGTNFIVTFAGNETDTDEPLVIVANYDTDQNEENPIDDNGSGIVGLLALSSALAQQVSQKKVQLKHSIVFAAVDVSMYKYVSKLRSLKPSKCFVLHFSLQLQL